MYSEPNKENFFSDLKDLIADYISIRLELAKINAFDKIARIITYLIIGVVSALLFFFGFLFLSLLLADFLSELFTSKLAGYGSVSLIYFLLFFWVSRAGNNWLGMKITNNIIRILFEQKNNTSSDETGENQ